MRHAGARGKSNSNERGNSYARRRRREWLIEQFGWATVRALRKDGPDAKKTWVKCHHCARRMQAHSKSWEIDRYPQCGHDGGRYVRGNIVISCIPCNGNRCGKAGRNCRFKRASHY